VLILATMLSMLALAMVFIPHQANAKVCVSTVSSQNDNNNHNNAYSTCNHLQNPNNDDHSTIKDETPFILAIPFP